MHTVSPQQWDTFVRNHPRAHALQLSAWGTLKSAFGWSTDRAILLDDDRQIIAGAQLLFRPLPMKLGTIAYLPFGGFVTDDAQWDNLWQAVERCAREHRAAFVKWEPGFYINEAQPTLQQWGFIESPQTIQPPRTIMLDIQSDDDTIMKRMNQGTRRKIRKSLKNDIHYYEATRADVDKFTQMMATTGERNEFGVHTADYYQMAYDLFVPEDAALLMAEHDGDPLTGLMVFQSGSVAQYIYGASSSIKRNLMATYGIQWQAIQWAKERGCTQYDMWGAPDEDLETLEAQFQERSDGLWGVYGFKRGWGGEVMRSAGTWDKVYNPLVYTAYKTALKLRG